MAEALLLGPQLLLLHPSLFHVPLPSPDLDHGLKLKQ